MIVVLGTISIHLEVAGRRVAGRGTARGSGTVGRERRGGVRLHACVGVAYRRAVVWVRGAACARFGGRAGTGRAAAASPDPPDRPKLSDAPRRDDALLQTRA